MQCNYICNLTTYGISYDIRAVNIWYIRLLSMANPNDILYTKYRNSENYWSEVKDGSLFTWYNSVFLFSGLDTYYNYQLRAHSRILVRSLRPHLHNPLGERYSLVHLMEMHMEDLSQSLCLWLVSS